MSYDLDMEPLNPKGSSIPSVSSQSSGYSGVLYNGAVAKTIYDGARNLSVSNVEQPSCWTRFQQSCCGGCLFQVLLVLVFLVVSAEITPLLDGLSFLEKEPKHYQCKDRTDDGQEVWRECSKEEICDRGLKKDEEWRPESRPHSW